MASETEVAPVKIMLPCGCQVVRDDKDTVACWIQPDLGMRIMQCKTCKLVIGVSVERPANPGIQRFRGVN